MADFLIIGGGVAGLSAGARLAELGRVVLLEAETALGYHTSGRSAALYEASYGLPATIALNLASRDWHETANGGYLTPRGLMLLGRAEDRANFDADVAAMRLEPIALEAALDRVPILNPDAVTHAAVHEDALDIDTDRMLQDFARAIRATGGQVLTGAAVTAIRRDAGGWQVETATGSHGAPVLVNAAGAWADRIAQLAGVAPIGLQPMRRSMARLPAPGGQDVRKWPMMMGAGETWYAKPDAGKLIVSPAEEHPVEPHDAWADDMVLAEGLARYEACVTTPVTRLETSWAGLRSFAPDRALVLGPDPDRPDFIWCAGQGGYGFQTAPAASQLLADLVAGRAPNLDPAAVAALTPNRLRR